MSLPKTGNDKDGGADGVGHMKAPGNSGSSMIQLALW